MAQHDFSIANAGGATVRADINNLAAAIQSSNSGTSAPSATSAGMFWLDTTGGAPYTLKIRDAGNNHWLTVASITDPGSDENLSMSAIEGTSVLSAGESGTAGGKFLGVDGDGSSSWRDTFQGTLGSSAVFPALHGIVGLSGCNVYPASVTSCAASAETKILFATEEYDIAGEFASNKFTATVAGKYYIMVQISLQDFEDGKAMQAKIMKNGSQVAFVRVNNGRADHCSGNVSTIVTLSASDYIEGYVWHNNSVSRNSTSGANADTFMIIMRLT